MTKNVSRFYLLTVLLFLSLASAAQKAVLRIKVKDEDNLNLPGASISLEPGAYKGVTNQNGEWAI
ncbi:MAG: hypothetical protein JNL59_06525, partial [Chitinophagaceae bacterium]|nr:hypothetical protein [Chitinophagaceae bacterium]